MVIPISAITKSSPRKGKPIAGMGPGWYDMDLNEDDDVESPSSSSDKSGKSGKNKNKKNKNNKSDEDDDDDDDNVEDGDE